MMTSILLVPLAAAFIWALANYLDKFIIEKIIDSKAAGSLILFLSLCGIPVSLTILFFKGFSVFNIGTSQAFFIILAGIFYLCAILPYLWAMAIDEVSNVVPQLLMAPVLTIIIGYLFLHEQINISQIVGAVLIMAGAIALNMNSVKSLHLPKMKIFGLILLSSMFFSINRLVFKYEVLDSVDFWTAIFWEHIGFIDFAFFIALGVPKYKAQFINLLKTKGKLALSINLIGEALTLLGNFALHYATLFMSVGLAQIIAEGAQYIFVLMLGMFLSLLYPHIIKEDIERRMFIKKTAFIMLMIIGMLFLNYKL